MHGKGAAIWHPTGSRSVDDQPRIFSQTFMLVPDTESDAATSQVKYYVLSDDMRFVG